MFWKKGPRASKFPLPMKSRRSRPSHKRSAACSGHWSPLGFVSANMNWSGNAAMAFPVSVSESPNEKIAGKLQLAYAAIEVDIMLLLSSSMNPHTTPLAIFILLPHTSHLLTPSHHWSTLPLNPHSHTCSFQVTGPKPTFQQRAK